MDMQIVDTGSCKVGCVVVDEDLTAVIADQFRRKVAAWMAPGKDVHDYVIDLSAVHFIDSAGFGALISILRRVQEMGGEIKLAGLQPGPRKVFEIILADRLFNTYDSYQDAMESYC